MRDNRPIISITILIIGCLGLLILTGLLSMGALALRKALSATMTATATPLFVSTQNMTPTTIQLASPAAPAVASPTTPAITAEPPPDVTFAPPPVGPVPAPTQPLVGFVPGGWCVPWNSDSTRAQVVRVIDGVTFEASIDNVIHQVRYIGLDPLDDTGDAGTAPAMLEKNRSFVEGKTVLLIQGTQDDLEDPLLRYVIVDGIFVNLELIQSGYAQVKNELANSLCKAVFSGAQEGAIAVGRGLWAATPTPTITQAPATSTVSPFGDVVVVNVSKRGNGWQEPEEYVEIFNSGNDPVQLDGWSVSDIENHIFWFPGFVLGPGEYCRVYTDQYWPKHCGFTFHNPAPIWDNNGDCAYLRDMTGKLVDKFCYD